jgi:transcriptional regulator with XRE-family HTH domain
MSQHKKQEFAARVREFRGRAKLSQAEFGVRLGVTGNYVSMIELGRKRPGPMFIKFFEELESAPQYQAPEAGASGRGSPSMRLNDAPPQGVGDRLWAMLSTESLIRDFVEIAEKLSQPDRHDQRRVVGNLRELLDEIERRLRPSSGGLSEAQRMALKAAGPDGRPGTK